MVGFSAGAALLLGALLVSAGLLKLLNPGTFQHAVYRLLPDGYSSAQLVRFAAPAVGVIELVVGGALLASPWMPGALPVAAVSAGTLLYLGFVGIITVAIRKGVACGCWSSFSDSVAGGAELGRVVALAVISLMLLVVHLGWSPTGWEWVALAWLAGLGLAVLAATWLGGRLLPKSAEDDATAAVDDAHSRGLLGIPTGLMFGAITSGHASLPLVGTGMTIAERAKLVRVVRSTGTWRSLQGRIGERSAGIRWDRAFVQQLSLDTGLAGGRSFVLTPVVGEGISLIVALQMVEEQVTECVVMGTVDGASLWVSGDEVRLGGAARPDGARQNEDGGRVENPPAVI